MNRVLLDVQRLKGSTKSKPPNLLSAEEEDILREAKELLSPLARTTKELSGESVTLSKVIPVIRNLRRVSIISHAAVSASTHKYY